MRQQKADRSGVDTLRNHFIGKLIPGVGRWGELDVLRGWKDDFLGDSLHEQYTTQLVGGAVNLPATAGGDHGGIIGFRTNAGANNFARLWLGDAANSYASLDADEGWLMFVRMKVNVSIAGNFHVALGARNVAGTRVARCGIHSWVIANNWSIEGTDGLGTTRTDTLVAFDTDWHWHVLDVYPIIGARQIDYWLDGSLIGSHATNVPTDILTPYISVYNIDAAARSIDVDVWAVIPRNL